jgi:hypothetical protein
MGQGFNLQALAKLLIPRRAGLNWLGKYAWGPAVAHKGTGKASATLLTAPLTHP